MKKVSFITETRYTAIVVRSRSLVGVSKERPVSFGNYCDVMDGRGKVYRCLNMWAENIDHWNHIKLDPEVRVRIYDGKFLIVDDLRIPPEYYNNKCCFTGGERPSIEAAEDIYRVLGDPNNEFEQFYDPISYYARRNQRYNPKSSFITWSERNPVTLDDWAKMEWKR